MKGDFFVADITKAQDGKKNKILDAVRMYGERGVMTRRAFIDLAVAENLDVKVEMIRDVAAMEKLDERIKFLAKTVPWGNERHPETIRWQAMKQELKDGVYKPEYQVWEANQSYTIITKTEYDYALGVKRAKELEAGLSENVNELQKGIEIEAVAAVDYGKMYDAAVEKLDDDLFDDVPMEGMREAMAREAARALVRDGVSLDDVVVALGESSWGKGNGSEVVRDMVVGMISGELEAVVQGGTNQTLDYYQMYVATVGRVDHELFDGVPLEGMKEVMAREVARVLLLDGMDAVTVVKIVEGSSWGKANDSGTVRDMVDLVAEDTRSKAADVVLDTAVSADVEMVHGDVVKRANDVTLDEAVLDGAKVDFARDVVDEKIEGAIRGISEHFGLDDGELKKFIGLPIDGSNINEYGRYDKLRKGLDRTKAKEYFEELEGKEIEAFRVHIKVDQLLRDFLIDGVLPKFNEVAIAAQVEQDAIVVEKTTLEQKSVDLYTKTYREVLAMKLEPWDGGSVKDLHRTAIKVALLQNKIIPDRVLNDYPEIKMQVELETLTGERRNILYDVLEGHPELQRTVEPFEKNIAEKDSMVDNGFIETKIEDERNDFNGQEHENPVLRSLGEDAGRVSEERTFGEVRGDGVGGGSAALSRESTGRVQQEVLGFSGEDDGDGGRDRGSEGTRRDGVGRNEQQYPGKGAGDVSGGDLPVSSSVSNASGTSRANPEREERVVKGGFKKQVFERNIDAIRLLKELEREGRDGTAEERVVLQGFAGFGGLPDAFDESKDVWKDEYLALKELLTEDEYRAARASTLTAHFTSDVVINGMYEGLRNLGFEGGSILEPSCGNGNFFANMPTDMADGSRVCGVELDSLTGRIAQKVYPNVSVSVQGFETTKFANDSFDLAIGNVPFGEYKINDPAYKDENFLIHDYFLAKMMDQVRPGGLVAVITSKGTMDKKDAKVREYLARRGELVKAIRLPNDAFKAAGTEVTADILVFKKRERMLEGEIEFPSWTQSKTWDDEHNISVNSYFTEHPEDVMGTLLKKSTAYGFDMTCKPSVDMTLEEQLRGAFAGLSKEYHGPTGEVALPTQPVEAVIKRPYSFFFQDDKLYYGKDSVDDEITGLTVAQEKQMKACIEVRDLIRNVIDSQKNDESNEVIQGLQRNLTRVYDDYVQDYGRIGPDKGLKKIFEDDASYPLLRSLEVFKDDKFVGKSDIFSKRTITPYVVPDHADTAADALMISMQEKGRVNLGYMMGLSGISKEEMIQQLEFTSIYYDVQKAEYQLTDEYLSGDIRGKIEYLENLTVDLGKQREDVLRDLVTPWTDATEYEPKNGTESHFLSMGRYGRLDTSDKIYFREHADDLEFTLTMLGKFGSSLSVPDQYKEDPLFALKAYKYGKSPDGISGGERLLKKVFNEIVPDKRIYQPLTVDDAVLYSFLEKKFTEYNAGDRDVLKNDLKGEWEQYQVDVAARKEGIVMQGESETIQEIVVQLELVSKNLTVLESVKPKDLEPSEIQVELGAPWIPTKDIEKFLFETLSTSRGTQHGIDVHYSSVTGNWRIDGKGTDYGNPKAEMTYGLSEMNAYQLVEHALNLKEAKIHKTIYVDGNEKRVVDKEKTVLAQQKQEMLKSEFSQWIWKDPERRERIAGFYNRNFNNIRPREYSGQYLTFPGMNPEIKLREHQKDAIAHTLYGGNTLLAHCVGAGKTYEMVASVMEAKRLGISKKAMVVVPKHLTEQFGAEFLQLYPSANILVATQKDFEAANRKEFCSKIATRDWDAVVMGYTQFEKIPISNERMTKLLNEQIDDVIEGIREAKAENGERFTIKQMEMQRKTLEGRLANLQKKDSDQTLVFEDLGVDRLYVDEAHYYKNLHTFTKMQNIPGIATTDAQKTTDMYNKCQYLNEVTNGKGIVFATGTPISNSMTELFTMQRYLQPDRLESEGLKHFDTWASTFGKTVTAIELSPEGKGFRSKTRFAKFHNLPELMSMFKEIADIKTADMLKLPVPEAELIVNRIAATEEQKDMVDQLAERSEKIRSGQVNAEDDNMLMIINEGRKLALDQRLIDPSLPDNPNSKVNQCVTTVYDIFESTKDQKSTQMIFCDLSTPTGGKGFSVYEDIKTKLISKGIPANEIAFIHDAKNEKQKDQMFAKVRSGAIRVIIGSTPMMGTGTNVQNKLVALHDLDVPWRPSDLEQRRGRIVRQGNENSNVKVCRYVTEGTFDAYLWQILENKQRFISQIMTSKTPVRTAEDVDEATLSYAEIKAIATGNPLIKEKMDVDIQLEKLKMAKASHLSNQHRLEHSISNVYPEKISRLENSIRRMQEDVDHARAHTRKVDGKEEFSIVLNGRRYVDRKEAGEVLLEAVKGKKTHELRGEYKGMKVSVMYDISEGRQMMVLSNALTYRTALGDSGTGNLSRLDHLIANIPDDIKQTSKALDHAKEVFEASKIEVNVGFSREDEFKEKLLRSKELENLLNLDAMSESEKVNERARRMQRVLDPLVFENKVEQAFKELALATMKGNPKEWDRAYEHVIGAQLVKEGYSKEEVLDVLLKFSPEVSGREELKVFVEGVGALVVDKGSLNNSPASYFYQKEIGLYKNDDKAIMKAMVMRGLDEKEIVLAVRDWSRTGPDDGDAGIRRAKDMMKVVRAELGLDRDMNRKKELGIGK